MNMTRNMRKMTVLMLAAFLASTPAMAEESGKDGAKGAKDDTQQQMEERFMKGDKNQDGYLSKEEMWAEHEKRFNEMFEKGDKDNDGRLSREEMRDSHKAMREKFKKRMEERREKMGEKRGEDGDKGGREKFRERMEERRGGGDSE